MPLYNTVPLVGVSKPARIRKRVVFPDPLGPNRVVIFPYETRKFTP